MSILSNTPPAPPVPAASLSRAASAGFSVPEPSRRLAHELSNLLDGAMRNVSLATSSLQTTCAETDPGAVQQLRTARDVMRRMTTLLKLWMQGGNDQGTDRLFWQAASLAVVIKHSVRMLEPERLQRGVKLTVDLDAAAGQTDAGSIMQVIVNALRNAMEAVGRDGEVTLIARREGGEVVLQVLDSGPGLTDGLPRDGDGLTPAGTSTKKGGHGIGLALSRQIVQSMGGRLTLMNRPEGGAELRVRYPVN